MIGVLELWSASKVFDRITVRYKLVVSPRIFVSVGDRTLKRKRGVGFKTRKCGEGVEGDTLTVLRHKIKIRGYRFKVVGAASRLLDVTPGVSEERIKTLIWFFITVNNFSEVSMNSKFRPVYKQDPY